MKEEQKERMYTLEHLKNTLDTCGFEFLGVFSDYEFGKIEETTPRFYIAARAKK